MKNLILLCCIFSLTFQQSFSQSWNLRLDFNETGMPGFPISTTTLVNSTVPIFTTTYDVLNRGSEICVGRSGVYNYTKNGGDGIDDLRVTVTRVTNATNNWTQVEGDYSTTSLGSFRSDYGISDMQSKPNDWAYIKVEFEFLGDLSSSICPSLFETRYTSTNGMSEAYEWTLVSINNELTPAEEMNIANYTNLIYSDLSGSSYFDAAGNVINPTAATNMPLPNGETISEFITGTMDMDGSPGGLLRKGLWTIDDFNTTILDGPEAATTNPATGNGSVNDDQTLNAIDDFGFTLNDPIQTITYYFGLADVAFDTNNNGTTRTNTLPAASVTYFNLGFPTPPTVASTDGSCGDNSGTATINVTDGSPDFSLSGDLNGSGFSNNTIMASGLEEGTYDFTVTDAKGCQAVGSVVVDLDCALPVELTYFKAKAVKNGVLLEWQTESEIDNARFEIERSMDGKNFIMLSKVKGHGTTIQKHSYNYLDQLPLTDINYYRLKQIDLDGSFEYSSVIVMRLEEKEKNEIKVYPSLALDWLRLEANKEIEYVEIWTLSGKLVRTIPNFNTKNISLDVSNLSSAYYLLRIKTVDNMEVSSFVKE